jgi:transglutaminase-like putative cysteine protease
MAWQVLAAVFAYAVLLESAIETFVRGSSVRWWVVAIAALYTGIAVVCWRRTSWPARAASSLLVLLGILAVTAWLPGGLENGVRLLGFSTSTLLSLAVATGVAVGAFVLVRGARIPRGVRVAITVLAAYAVIACLYGAAAGVSFTSLLSGGDSFWHALPRLLQGAAVGGLIVVSAALVAVAIRLGTRHPSRGSTQHTLYQAVAIATSFAIIVVGYRAARTVPQTPAESNIPQVAESVPSKSLVKSAEDMDIFQLLQRSDELSRSFKRVDWDVLAKAEELGPGVEPAFMFLRDRIAYEPYAGVLRGPAGTYASRAGNAVDRALLLAELLRLKKITTRFAVGTLDHLGLERLFLHTFERGLPNAAGQGRRLDEGDLFHQRLFRRARQDYEAVRAALGTAIKPVTAPSRDAVLAEMNPHVWLQAQIDGSWIDLDTSLPDSTPGHPIAAVERTLDSLSDDQFQHVTMRVIDEHLVDGNLRRSTGLEVTRKAVDLIDTQIVLIHTQPMSATGLGSAIARSLGRSTDDRWMPALWIAGEFTVGQPVDAAEADLVAEWLEFELTWPDGRREVTRRPLIDRAGAAWRSRTPRDAASLRPLARDGKGALAMQALHNIWFSAGGHRLTDFADATGMALLDEATKVLAEHDSQNGVTNGGANNTATLLAGDDFARQVWPLVLQNFATMIWTDHIVLPLLNNTPGVRLYAEAPRITIFTAAPVGEGLSAMFMDLRRDDLRGIAVDSSKTLLLADKKLRFGALQAALEHETMAEVTRMATGSFAGVRSTSSLLAGKPLAALDPGALVEAPSVDAAVEVGAAIVAGRTVVASSADLAQTHAWWEILPDSGDTRAIAEWGLRGSGTPPIDRNNPFLIKKKMQQNPWGGQKEWDVRSEREIWQEEYDARMAKLEQKAQAQAAEYRNSLAKPQQTQTRGGGVEYAVLLTIGALAKIAVDVLAFFTLVKLFEQIELFVYWIAAGGFQAEWP